MYAMTAMPTIASTAVLIMGLERREVMVGVVLVCVGCLCYTFTLEGWCSSAAWDARCCLRNAL